MSNRVWVRFKLPISDDWLFDVQLIRKDDYDADITDLRGAFVQKNNLRVSPTMVEVRETEDGEKISEDKKLRNYFVPPEDSAALPGPGRSKETALFLSVLQQQAENNPFKTPQQRSEQRGPLSPTLRKALEKLKDEGIDILYDLPFDNLESSWSELKEKLKFEDREWAAVKRYRESILPADIVRTVREHQPRLQRKPLISVRLHSSVSTLYTYNQGRPDFLTFRLGEHSYSNEATRDAIKETMKTSPVCVAGVSGAGKTRTVLEILSTQWGIYFSASWYDSKPTYKPCSADLAWIARESESDLPETTTAKTERRIECAVVARLLILEMKLKMEGTNFSYLDWVLMQLYPPKINEEREDDVFLELTKHLYLSRSSDERFEPLIGLALGRVTDQFKCIVVDEAQVAMRQNEGRYSNVDRSNKHPFLYAVIRCLWKVGKTKCVICGTGISIMKMSKVAVSAIGEVKHKHARDPADRYKMLVPISTVLEPKDIYNLVQEILLNQTYEQHQVGLWSRILAGRPRVFWGFLSLALTTTDGIDSVFQYYCNEMTSGEEDEDGSLTTLFSSLKKALGRRATGETSFSPSIGSAVSEMVVNWLTGQNPPQLEDEEMVDWIVDCGVCILERNEGKTKLVARLREPLVVQAYLEYIKRSSPDAIVKTIMRKLENASEPSSQGFLFEILFYFAFQKSLNGKSLRDVGLAPSDSSDFDFLDEVCDLPLESIGCSLLRLPETPDRSPVELQSQFLDCHRLYLECPTNRPRPRAAATPAKKDTDDLVVVAHTEKHVLIFLIQCKLEQNTDYLKAVQTTFPGLLLHQSKKRKLDTAANGRSSVNHYTIPDANKTEYDALQHLLRSEQWGTRKVCVVQLVVAYPATVSKLGETRWIPNPPQPCTNSDELAELLNRVPQDGDEKSLLVVVKEDLLRQLLGGDVFARLNAVKVKPKAGEDEQNGNFVETMNHSDLLPYEGRPSTS